MKNWACLLLQAAIVQSRQRRRKAIVVTQQKKNFDGNRLSRLFQIGFVIWMGLAGGVFAQGETRTDGDIAGRPFWVNVFYFRDQAEEKTLVEVCIEIPYASVAFHKAGAIYESTVEVGVMLDDANGFQVEGNDISQKLQANDFEATLSHRLTYTFYFAFRIAPGNYALRLMIGDDQARQRFSYACRLNVPSYRKPQLQISSLLLARFLELSNNEALLQKNGRSLIPNVPHLFAAEKRAGFTYFEVYHLSLDSTANDSFQVLYRLSRLGKEVYSTSWLSAKPGAKAAINLPLNLQNLEEGEYWLHITVVEQQGKRQASASSPFYVTRAGTPTPALGVLDAARILSP